MKKSKSLDTKLCVEVINRIKKDNIKQTPKIIFFLKNLLLWFILIISIVIGALSISLTFQYLYNADWYLLSKIGFFKILIVFTPLLWFIFLVISTILSYYFYKNTEKGYKFTFIKIFFVNILLSCLIGILFFLSGFNSYIDGLFEKQIPQYRESLVEDNISRMIKVWQNPEQGLLIGEILKIYNTKVILKDFNNEKWNIYIDDKTNIKHSVYIQEGIKIKIIGRKLSNINTFKAQEIRPFIGKRHNWK